MERDSEGGRDSRGGGLSEKRDAVYKPSDLALAERPGIGSRTSLIEKSTASRREYLDEMKRDLEEITEEIIKTDTLKDILSMLTTKYAIERNILSLERTLMSEENSLMGERRTQASQERTEMAENRSGLSRLRTQLSQRRVFLAEKRTLMAQQRTFLAKARTELAFMRTGVALVVFAIGLIRYFGLGWWNVVDVSILLLGLAMVVSGIYYYLPTRKQEVRLFDVIRQKDEELMKRKPRIMVVDDDVSVCNSLKIHLGKGEWVVEAFTSPYVARHRLESTQFDVVITDFMMDEMTGVEFLHHIQRLSPFTQVILMSRMEMLDEFVENIKGELFDYFSKPINVKELRASVKRALEEKMML
jgi:CheY-like chemotaxis protein/uncharacterized membrane protein YidH (DUF202 family)